MTSHDKVLFNSEMLENTSPFNDLNDPSMGDLLRAKFMDSLTQELDAAIGNLTVFVIQKAGNRLEGSALSRSVGAQKGDNASRGNFDGHSL